MSRPPTHPVTRAQFGRSGSFNQTSSSKRLLLEKHAPLLEQVGKGSSIASSLREHNSKREIESLSSESMGEEGRVYSQAAADAKLFSERCNFRVHGKRFMFAPRSLYLFGEANRLRQLLVWVTQHPAFDWVVLILILLNSLALAILDYDLDAIDAAMEPDATKSLRNYIPAVAAPVFTALFTLECVLKIVAMGFVLDSGSYLRNGWNCLDFAVVVSGVLTSIPGMPKISALRVFRVLRPLRTIEFLPGLKLLVTALLRSIPQLLHVLSLLTFIFLLFGILGLQIWSGNLNSRCRLTQYPVAMPSHEVDLFYNTSRLFFTDRLRTAEAAAYMDQVLTNRTMYPYCGASATQTALPLSGTGWTHDTSPWNTPRDCLWPIDETDTFVCTQSGTGAHSCAADQWCGSDYDPHGNARFTHERVMREATFIPELMFGITTFDWIFPAFLTIFECITLESWADIMYMVQDASSELVGAVYFTVLILFGAFLILNLTLAVIWGNLKTMQDNHLARQAREEEVINARNGMVEEEGDSGGEIAPGMLTSRRSPRFDFRSALRPTSPSRPGLISPARANALANLHRNRGPPVFWHEGSNGSSASGQSEMSNAVDPVLQHVSAAAHSAAVSDRQRPPPLHIESPTDCKQSPLSHQESIDSPTEMLSYHPGAVVGSAGSIVPHSGKQQSALSEMEERMRMYGGGTSTFMLGNRARASSDSKLDISGKLQVKKQDATRPAKPEPEVQPRAAQPQVAGSTRMLAKLLGADGEEKKEANTKKGTKPVFLQRKQSSFQSKDTIGAREYRGMFKFIDNVVKATTGGRGWHKGKSRSRSNSGTVLKVGKKRALLHSPGPSTARGRLKAVVLHWMFNAFILMMITLNTVVLAMDQHPMDPTLATQLENINFVLTVLFFIEMVMKVTALGIPAYVRDRFNVFDAFIVIVSTVEIIISPPDLIVPRTTVAEAGGAVSALRTFRLFRVFSIARSWVSLRMLLRAIIQTLKDVANFALLLLLFLYIFSLVGMQFFANRFHFDPVTRLALTVSDPGYDEAFVPRTTFDNLLWSVVTVFQVLTAENWNQVMHDGVRSTGLVAVVYFLILVVTGNFIVLNLFLAILLGNFEGLEVLTIQEKQKARQQRLTKRALQALSSSYRNLHAFMAGGRRKSSISTPSPVKIAPLQLKAATSDAPMVPASPSWQALALRASAAKGVNSSETDSGARVRTALAAASGTLSPGESEEKAASGMLAFARQLRLPDDPELDENDATSPTSGEENVVTVTVQEPERKDSKSSKNKKKRKRRKRRTIVLTGKSCCMFSPRNSFRKRCAQAVVHPLFDNCVLGLILISSVLLAVDTPLLDPDSDFAAVLSVLDLILSILFACEMLIKIVVLGFVVGKGTYLRNGWNVLDFLIVMVSVLTYVGGGAPSLRSLRSLRTLRALRPLRMISRNPGLKLVVNALFRAIPSIINVLFVCILFFLIFGIVGVSYFKGLFMACQGDAFENLSKAQVALVEHPVPFADLDATQAAWGNGTYTGDTSKAVCLWLGATWGESIPQSFDNILDAAGALFEMSTKEGWVDVMFVGVDATDLDMQPIRDNSPGWVVFFIAFMIIGNFFIMNLFVGVVIDNFNRMKEEMGENMFLTEGQREWVKTQENLLHVRPSKTHRPPKNSYWRQQVFYVVEASWFEIFILVCIIANTLVMAMLFFGQDNEYSDFLEAMNLMFAAIFTLEAIFKLTGLGFKQYFKDSWNIFDFTIVVGTLAGLILRYSGALDVGSVATIVRAFRMGRLIRIVQSAKSLRALFNTLIITLPSLGNVGGLLFLLYFIYAVLGVQVFSHVKHGEMLNEHANFRSFGRAIVTLLRCSTGENWNLLMYDLASPQGPCSTSPAWNDPIPQGCGVGASYVYFFSFILMVGFVMLNVFIAVILEGFGDMSDAENSILSKSQLQEFAHVWCRLDPSATMLIPMKHITQLFLELPPPMGFLDVHVTVSHVQRFIERMELPTYANKTVHFTDVLKGCAKQVVISDMKNRGLRFDEIPESHGVNRKWDRIKSKTRSIMSQYTARQVMAAERIKETFNVFQFQRALAKLEEESDSYESAEQIRRRFTTEKRRNAADSLAFTFSARPRKTTPARKKSTLLSASALGSFQSLPGNGGSSRSPRLPMNGSSLAHLVSSMGSSGNLTVPGSGPLPRGGSSKSMQSDAQPHRPEPRMRAAELHKELSKRGWLF